MKNTRLYLILLALMALTPMAWAQGLSGSGTTNDPYLINSSADWGTFAQSVTDGTTYAGQFVSLNADITVSTMAGAEDKCFAGTFNGQNHTITLNMTASMQFTSLFCYADGATFQNLKVDGTINTAKKFCAGFVGYVINHGCTFTNCVSDVTINSTINGDGTHGGLVAYVKEDNSTFEGCAFTGKLLGANTTYVGGLVGFTDSRNNATVSFTNCVFHPQQVTMSGSGSQTFARWYGNNSGSVIIGANCYYSQTLGAAQGKQMRSITGGDYVTVAFNGSATNYERSGISAYAVGIVFDSTLYAGNGEMVSLNLGCTPPSGYVCSGYTTSAGTLTGAANPYTLTMPNENVTIQATLWPYIDPCTAPYNLEVTNISATTATLHWTGAQESYNLRYRTFERAGEWVVVTAHTTTLNLTDLVPETEYEWQVQGIDCDGEGNDTEWSEIATFTTPEVCFTPRNLAANNITAVSADLSWTGREDVESYTVRYRTMAERTGEWITETTGETETQLAGLTEGTTYEAQVRSDCNPDGWCNMITFTTLVASCPAIASLAVDSIGGHMAVISWVETGAATAWQICVNSDEDNLIDVVANAGGDTITYTLEGLQQDADYTVKVRANCGEEDGISAWSNAVSFHTLVTCAAPTNLVADNIGTESATLMWEGESESYVVQYRPWEQVGDDQAAPSTMTTFTYDLSDYSVMGSIAIRHYNITDIFSVNVDNIVVTNAQGETVFSEDFEGSISPAISLMDLDGDGYNWERVSTDDGYCVSSESYRDYVGALNPDNWLIISNVELGGQLTFVAYATDPEWVGDNFGVFVSAEEGAGEEIVDGDTQIDLWDLTPNTSYAWQVKGICGEDESQWVASFFTTLDDYLTFVTDGDWNDANNWNPAEVPTTDKNVHIQANAIIPAGVVAEANNVTIESGSITIKDGGQMKLNSQAEVVMEKEITGYGEGNGNYYLIASPFTGRTQFGASTWSHVDSLIYGEYDLYTFDPANGEDEEWVNYKAYPEHIAYQSEAQGNQGLFEKKGYLYANQDCITLVFTGKINRNIGKTVKDSIVYDNNNKGWALVGNPYACDAYLSFVDDEGEMMEANYYVMNAAGDNLEQAETTNGIAPLTAAFVNFEATGYVRFDSEEPDQAKYTSTGKFIMSLNQDGNTVDKAVLRFGKGLNLEKMSLKNNSKLYFSLKDKDYAVVYSRSEANMPVSFKAETAGSYTINFAADGVSFKEFVLIDNVNETKVDLLAYPIYTFETEAGEFARRFTIVYRLK